MEWGKSYFSHIRPTKAPDFPILWIFLISLKYAIVYSSGIIYSNQLYK